MLLVAALLIKTAFNNSVLEGCFGISDQRRKIGQELHCRLCKNLPVIAVSDGVKQLGLRRDPREFVLDFSLVAMLSQLLEI